MRTYRGDSSFTGTFKVCLSYKDVALFAKQWPCIGKIGPLAFVFRGKELVDIRGDKGMDPEAVSVMAGDALLQVKP